MTVSPWDRLQGSALLPRLTFASFLAGSALWYILIDPGATGHGWGNKALVANLRMGKAFITQMGFHIHYWLCSQNYRQVRVPAANRRARERARSHGSHSESLPH